MIVTILTEFISGYAILRSVRSDESLWSYEEAGDDTAIWGTLNSYVYLIFQSILYILVIGMLL